jgi:hypothetical protein
MFIAAFFLIFAVVAFRLTTGLSGGFEFANFSPVAAVVLCGAAFLPKRFAIAVPLVAMLITDVALNLHAGYPIFTAGMLLRYLAFGAILAIGFKLRTPAARGTYGWKLFAGAAAGTVIFYLISNTGAWLSLPGYAKTFGGWWQAQTVGLPGFPPTVLFLRNSLAGDLFFTGLFAACFALAARTSHHPSDAAPAGARATH